MPSDMGFGRRHKDALNFSSSARRDARAWGSSIIGTAFVLGAVAFDPQKNCNVEGDCPLWMIPIFFVIGAAAGLYGLGQLMANPKRGSQIDPETGDLIWWQNRYGTNGGDEGRINPGDISLIRIDRRRESRHEVHIYNRENVLQPHFDEEVIGWDGQRWAEALQKRWPHIQVDVLD